MWINFEGQFQKKPCRPAGYNLRSWQDGACQRFEDERATDSQEWQRRSGQRGHRDLGKRAPLRIIGA